MAAPDVDVVVIGAGMECSTAYMDEFDPLHTGLSGMAFSRFFLDVHATCRLQILEEDTCVGGVWSACIDDPHEQPLKTTLTTFHSSTLQWFLVTEWSENGWLLRHSHHPSA